MTPRLSHTVAQPARSSLPTAVRRFGKAGGTLTAWAPLFVGTAMVAAFGARLPGWAWMWSIAFAIYAGFKWLTWWRVADVRHSAPLWRSLLYLLGWPGMDAGAFLSAEARPPMPARREWISAAIKTTFGAMLLWALCPHLPDDQPLAVGWAGMVGLIFLLHFGAFHLLALSWRSIGIDAQNLFESPALATSLAGFWGGRWNRAFRQLAHDLMLRPLARRIGTGKATVAAFVASGLVHDLVISIPAGGGYGLPTAYFALQGLGLLVERSRIGALLGLRRGWRGWLFMAALTAGPVFWLFHPPFVERVVVPFLDVIGAA